MALYWMFQEDAEDGKSKVASVCGTQDSDEHRFAAPDQVAFKVCIWCGCEVEWVGVEMVR